MKLSDIQIISADLGRGYAKGCTIFNDIEECCCFKSIVGTGRNLDLKEYKIEDRIYLEVEDDDFFGGILAEKESFAATPNSREDKTSLTARKLLWAVLSKLAKSSTVKIMLGVPNKAFNKRTLNEVQECYKGKTVIIKDLVSGSKKEITIADISIFRESDAAAMWQVRDITENNKPIGMVTIGFRTAEFSYFEKGLKFNDKKSKSMELGNKTCLEYVQRQLQKNNITDKELFEIDSEETDYNDLKAKGYELLQEKVLQEMDNFWINLDEMNIFVGGGTALKLNIKDYEKVEEPQMITAKGLYLVGTKVFK